MAKFIKKKNHVLEDDSPKKAEGISVNPLRSEVKLIDFLLVLMTVNECTGNL